MHQDNLDNLFQSFGEKYTPTDVSRPKNDGNEGAPDQEKATQPVGLDLPDNPAGDRNDMKLVGTIAGNPSPNIIDRRVHFPVGTEEQAKAAANRVLRLATSPDWYIGTVAELRAEVHAGIEALHPTLDVMKEWPEGKAFAEVVVKNPADVNEKEVPGVPTPTLENTGNKNDSKLLAQTLAVQANTDEGRKALAGNLTEKLDKQIEKLGDAKKLATRLEKDGLTGEEFDKLIDFLQTDILHELIFQGVKASVDRRAELLARMQERQN
jgi:hypothetical protein